MNKIKKIPLSIVTIIVMTILFTFVDPIWVMSTAGRFCYVSLTAIAILLATLMNAELKFWVYKEENK